MKRTWNTGTWAVGLMAACAASASGAPVLSLSTAGGSASVATINTGTPTFSLDLHFDSDGNALSGLQFYLNQSTGPSPLRYGGSVVAVLSPPLSAGDLYLPPVAGAALSAPTDTNYSDTWLFHSGVDYPSVNAAIATYTLDTASLLPGTYTITPVKVAYTFASAESPLAFNTPAFVLTVVTPEPATIGALTGGAAVLMRRRRGHRLS